MSFPKIINPLYQGKLVRNISIKGLEGTIFESWGLAKTGKRYLSNLSDYQTGFESSFMSKPVVLALLYMAANKAGHARALLWRDAQQSGHLPIPKFTIALNQKIRENEEVYTCEQPVVDSQGHETGEYIIGRCSSNGTFEAVKYSTKGAWSNLPQAGHEDILKIPMEGIYAMYLLRIFKENEEARNDFATIQAELDFEPFDPNAATNGADCVITVPDSLDECFFRICDAFCKAARPEDDTSLLKMKKFSGNNIPTIPQQHIDNGILQGTIVVGEQPSLLFGKNADVQAKSNMTVGDAKQFFAEFRNKQNWTDAEKEFIPKYDDDFPVLPEVMDIATLYTKSQSCRRPMVNFLWRGVTSYGKSIGVEVLASILNLPLLKMTCNSNMETQEFLTNYVPDNGDAGLDASELPSFEEISMDPEGSYEALTGESLNGATPQDCLDAYAVACSNMKNNNIARYKMVESNFVKALQYGYLCEVQEISRIRDAGVMVGINEYDRPGAHIPLVDGRFTVRSPQALVVYTDNVGYGSCRPVDPSVIRRMSYVIDSYELPKEKVIERVIYNTGFNDKHLLVSMYDVWKKIADYCADNEITEGSVSVTDLEMWAQAVMLNSGRIVENCKRCVIAKATSVRKEQKEIETAVLATAKFS